MAEKIILYAGGGNEFVETQAAMNHEVTRYRLFESWKARAQPGSENIVVLNIPE
jgi:hypothetical protein